MTSDTTPIILNSESHRHSNTSNTDLYSIYYLILTNITNKMAQTTNLKPVIQIMEFDRCLKYEPCEQNDVYFGCVEKS